MKNKFIHLLFLVIIYLLIFRINCEFKNKKTIFNHQNGLRYYQFEPIDRISEWLKAFTYSGQQNVQNRNQYGNSNNVGKNSLEKKSEIVRTNGGHLNDNKKTNFLNDKLSADMFPAKSTSNQVNELDEFEPVGAIDFELINFWPGLVKRDMDYGHLRFGRSADLKKPFYKKTIDKKIESDYGHFRFGK